LLLGLLALPLFFRFALSLFLLLFGLPFLSNFFELWIKKIMYQLMSFSSWSGKLKKN
jgi:hypothetical protein